MRISNWITEMEFKRSRKNFSYAKMAFNLGVSRDLYVSWITDKAVPNREQLKSILLWICDQLEIRDVPIKEGG